MIVVEKKDIEHITPTRVYLIVGVTLLILTGLTVKISTIHLGAWNAIVAIFIATLKALLVALFFMHLLYDKKIYMIVAGAALVILSIFIALTMADVLRRGDLYEFEAYPIKPQAQIYKGVTGDTVSTVHQAPLNDTMRIDGADTATIKKKIVPGDIAP
jgi:cytochrome c oxidase subunit IV